jgi:ParB family chromosome partitioning protein
VTEKKALGRGLGALIGDSRAALARSPGGVAREGRLRELSLADITVNRRQPRRMFAPEELEELAASIKALGVVQPVVVRPLEGGAGDATTSGSLEGPAEPRSDAGGVAAAVTIPAPRFELIAGERRLRAAALAGLSSIPALVRPADEVASLEIALAENVAREDLNSIEEALAYAALVDEFGVTHEHVAELVGRSRAAVSNLLRLLELPDDVQRMIEQGELSEGHGRALLALPGHEQRRRTARLVTAQGLSVRQTEALVKKLNDEAAGGDAPAARRPAADYSDLIDELYGVLEAPVRITSGARGGSIQIAFKSRAELERIVDLLRSLGA